MLTPSSCQPHHQVISWKAQQFGSAIVILTTMCSFIDAPHNFNNSWFLHHKKFPISHWFLIAFFFLVRNFRPSVGRGLPGITLHMIIVHVAQQNIFNYVVMWCIALLCYTTLNWLQITYIYIHNIGTYTAHDCNVTTKKHIYTAITCFKNCRCGVGPLCCALIFGCLMSAAEKWQLQSNAG